MYISFYFFSVLNSNFWRISNEEFWSNQILIVFVLCLPIFVAFEEINQIFFPFLAVWEFINQVKKREKQQIVLDLSWKIIPGIWAPKALLLFQISRSRCSRKRRPKDLLRCLPCVPIRNWFQLLVDPNNFWSKIKIHGIFWNPQKYEDFVLALG